MSAAPLAPRLHGAGPRSSPNAPAWRSPALLTALGLSAALAGVCAFFVGMQHRAADTEAALLAQTRWAQLQWQCSAVPNLLKREACVAQLQGPDGELAPRFSAPPVDEWVSQADAVVPSSDAP